MVGVSDVGGVSDVVDVSGVKVVINILGISAVVLVGVSCVDGGQ